jgi:hypothetical protein
LCPRHGKTGQCGATPQKMSATLFLRVHEYRPPDIVSAG